MRPLWMAALALASSPALARADEALPWAPPAGKAGVAVRPADGGPVLEVSGQAGPRRVTLLELTDPPVPSHQYVLRGRVKYENLAGDGVVEMLSTFPGHGTFFTKTLADAGPLAKLTGSSDWRDLELPFYAEPGMRPSKITVVLHLPAGGGSVSLAPLTVAALEGPGPLGGWWTAAQGNLAGALLGVALGLLGTLVGVLAAKGRARRTTLALMAAAIGFGVLCLAAGLAALATGQPYHVYYPLLLVGFISTVVFGVNLPAVRRRYAARELRQMAALDV